MHRSYVLSAFFIITQTTIYTAAPLEVHSSTHYEETPSSQKAVLNDPALLRCVAATRVERCRWTWRSFAPSTSSVQPVVVREFKAFGPSERDCSVRFRSLLLEHEGEWTCAILTPGATKFVEAPTAVIRVAHSDGVQFSDLPENTEVQAGEAAVMRCVVQQGTEVEWCRWTWRPLRQPNTPRIPVKEFPPFGNESRDCSVRFRVAQPEQSGEWSCGVRPRGQLNFQSTQPATLNILRREMQFVQLSQDLQVAAGETVLLRCVTAGLVHRCRWLWRPFGLHNTFELADPVEVKNFVAFGDDARDCSVRFSSVLPEQAGEWTCGVQPDSEASFQDAAPARLTILPAVKIRFVDIPEHKRVPSGAALSLTCTVTSGVSLCRWTKQLLDNTSSEIPHYPIEFAGQGNWSRDCTLTLKDVQPAHQGLWTCSVLGPPGTDTLYSAPPIKLTVYHPVTVEFSELTRAIQMPTGSPVLLRCITIQRVQQCRWIKRLKCEYNGTEEIHDETNFKTFAPLGDDKNDCSMRFTSVSPEHSGAWTCGAQPVGEDGFQDAPASRLTVLPQGMLDEDRIPTTSITEVHVVGWVGLQSLLQNEWHFQTTPHAVMPAEQFDYVTLLICISDQPFTSCRWINSLGMIIREQNQGTNSRFDARTWRTTDPEARICSLSIHRQHGTLSDSEIHIWRCCLVFETTDGVEFQVEASTNFTTLTAKNSSATTLVLLVMVIIGLVVVLAVTLSLLDCRARANSAIKQATHVNETQGYFQSNINGLSNDISKKVRFSIPVSESMKF